MRQLPSENSTPIELLVSANEAMLRLDQFMTKRLPEFSRSRLQQLIRDGFVRLNDSTSRPSQIVRGGDKIELIEPPLEKIEMFPEAIPVEILFEDDDLIVINKSPGLVVHPGAGHREHTLVNALLNHCATLSGICGKERPGIVHRFDTAYGLTRSACIFIITVIRCSAIKSMRRALQRIFHDKCCMRGSLNFAILALRNGKALKRRCLTISRPR